MSDSLEQWLELREAADARARNKDVAGAMRSWFLQRSAISVVDLAGGTGASLRAIAPLLADRQRWRLIEKDGSLITVARTRLSAWADTAEAHGEVLHLCKGAARIEVTFAEADILTGLDAVLGASAGSQTDLITASALFERTSPAFMGRFAAAAERARAAIYATLIYNGQQGWTPRHPTDRELLAGFHRFQMMDKGFGPATGPTAAVELSEALTAQGFSVTEGASPWQLGAADAALVTAVALRFAGGVAETGTIPKPEIDTWLKRHRTGVEVGHIDLFATPPAGTGVSMEAADDED